MNIKKRFLVATGIAIVIVLVIFIFAFNTSDKRYARAMEKAEQAYNEENFEKASANFEKAIEIKQEYVAPYLGLLCAKEAMGSEDIKEVFESGLEAIGEMDEDTKFIEQNQVVEYVLHESEVYADDLSSRIEALDKGYEETCGAEDISRILSECVASEVDELRASDSYDEAIALAERFEEKAEYDSVELLDTLEKEKEFSELKADLLDKVYDSLINYEKALESHKDEDLEPVKDDVSSDDVKDADVSGNDEVVKECVASPLEYDFGAVFELDNAEETNRIVFSFTSDSYVNIDKTGKHGAGIYTFGNRYRTEKGGVAIPYYFFVGEYEENVKNGFGIAFTAIGENSFVVYVGEWKDDMPNGKGKKYIHVEGSEEEKGYNRVYSGNWKDGLADGEILVEATEDEWDGVVYNGSINAKEGICDTVPTESEDYVVTNLRTENLIGVLPSNTEGYALMLTIWKKEGTLLKAIEF